MNTSKVLAFVAIVSAFALAGCRKEIDEKDMAALAAWSTAMCACAEKGDQAKACAAQLEKPFLSFTNDGGKLLYTRESMLQHAQVEAIGLTCYQKVSSQ